MRDGGPGRSVIFCVENPPSWEDVRELTCTAVRCSCTRLSG